MDKNSKHLIVTEVHQHSEYLNQSVRLWEAAFSSSKDKLLYQAFHPNGVSEEYMESIEQEEADMIETQQNAESTRRIRWVAVVDEHLGKVVAAAKLAYNGFDTVSSERPSDVHQDSKLGDQATLDSNEDALRAFYGLMNDAKRKLFGDGQFLEITMIATLPGQERRGAARLALEWAFCIARETETPLFLASAPAAQPFYLKCGLIDTFSQEFDLRPYGVDGIYVSHNMLWYPENISTRQRANV